jgi:hypothetical protein
MVNVRYKVQKASGIVGKIDHDKKCEDDNKEEIGWKKSVSQKVNRIANFFRTPE